MRCARYAPLIPGVGADDVGAIGVSVVVIGEAMQQHGAERSASPARLAIAGRPLPASPLRGDESMLGPSAHVDRFARDNLLPPELWPDFLLDDFRYPRSPRTRPSNSPTGWLNAALAIMSR